ncbi:MAG: fluoride efflux transporter CrcB [bacterium]|nr:fluoride efflux transporter CrcB [bacterium]
MIKILIVGLGGFIGSVFRYLLGNWVSRLLNNPEFPYGTLTVNILGCLVIGFLGGIVNLRQGFTPETRLFLFVGILGGFTTFSSFGYETFLLLNNGKIFTAGINIVAQVFIGLAAVWIGYRFSGICL